MRVAICTPCQDTVDAGFAIDLARLVAHVAAEGTMGFTLIQNRGTIIPQQRATLVEAARKAQATHLLWLDSDMRFPKDALHRLAAHGKPIVAANYPTRRPPILPTAQHREMGHLFTPSGATGLEEVTYAGMGVMLVDMAVFQAVPEPWFIVGYNAKGKEYIGEDCFFGTRAKEHGFPTLIDQELSYEIKHVGSMEYRAEHAMQTRDIYAAMTDTPRLVLA